MPARKIDPRRLDAVEDLWKQHWDTRAIEREIAERFKISRRQARHYIAIVRKRMTALAASVSPDQRLAEIDGMMVEGYRAAQIPNVLTGQPNAAAMIAAAHRRAELFGVISPQKVKLDATVTGIADLLATAFDDEGSGEGSKG